MRLLLFTGLLISGMTMLHAQDIYYYGVNSRPVDSEEDALWQKEVRKKSSDTYVVITSRTSPKGWKKENRKKLRVVDDHQMVIFETLPNRLFPRKIEREIRQADQERFHFRDTHQEQLLLEGFVSRLIPLHFEGEIKEYYPGGTLKSISYYSDNQLKANQNWLQDGTPYVDSIFYSADRVPRFQFGVTFFNSYLIASLENEGIDLNEFQDDVLIGLVIMENGELKAPVALRGKSGRLTETLVQIVRDLPGKWDPALLDGEPVRYFMTLPITISHRDITFQNVEVSSGVLHYTTF
jgi:hypothetical protein